MYAIMRLGLHGPDGKQVRLGKEKDGTTVIQVGRDKWVFDERGKYVPEVGEGQGELSIDGGQYVPETTQEEVTVKEPKPKRRRSAHRVIDT